MYILTLKLVSATTKPAYIEEREREICSVNFICALLEHALSLDLVNGEERDFISTYYK